MDAVVDRALGVDDEGPIAGLEKKQLASGASQMLGDRLVGLPGQLGDEAGHAFFGAVFDFPHPAGFVVHPDGVVAIFSPGAFGHAHDFVGNVVGNDFLGGQ